MWKKIIIIGMALFGCITFCLAMFNDSLFASTASQSISKLKQGNKVIMGTNQNNQEVVWQVNVDDYQYYTLSTVVDKAQLCTATTDNGGASGNLICYCMFMATTSGKDNSPAYGIAKAFDDVFSASIVQNDFEKSELIDQSAQSVGAMKYAFIPSPLQIYVGQSLGFHSMSQLLGEKPFVLAGLAYDKVYNNYGFAVADKDFSRNFYAGPTDVTPYSDWISMRWVKHPSNVGYGDSNGDWAVADVRPFIQLKKDRIVAVLDTTYEKNQLYATANQGNTFKIRYYDSTYTVSFSDIKYKNKSVVNQKLITDRVVQLDAVANDTLSVLVFNDAGDQLLYYKALNNNDFDMTGIPAGKYQIAVMSEHFDSNTGRPMESSLISEAFPLEIVEPLEFSVTAKMNMEYGNNVNNGDVVATYTTSNGVSPIMVTLVSDTSVSGHENDYQMFSISNGNIMVNDPNGLDAGDYYFKVNAIDDNGDPAGGIDSGTIHITVAKINTTIAFNDPNMTKKSIADAGTSWSETATATSSNGTKVSYTKVGGDIGMINIDPDTGAITYNGGNAFGKVKIRATVDDDPSTGKDNYNSSFVEKEIVIYREVDGVITPDPVSSDTTIPTFSAGDTNIKTGGTIGKIQGTLGTPDTIGGSTTTYSYTIKLDPTSDGSLFQVNSSTGVIKANANLGVDTYNFVIIVSDKWSSKEIPVIVNVGKAPAENLKFYQSPTSNTIITTKSAALTDTGVTVFATVKGSSNTNPVTYRIKDGSTNVITVHPNSGAITINGVGSVIIVAEKAGNTGQASAIAELTFTVTAGSQQFIYTDASGNELPKSGNDYDDYSEVYGQGKTFQLYTAGNPAGTNVTYALKAGSPTDVISVDPNGLVSILNASLKTQIGQVIVEATSHDPAGNYTDKTIELPINITKANQTISFSGITAAQNGKGKVTPIINAQDISGNDGGVTVNDTNYYISVDPSASGIAWTNNGVDIEYNYSGDTTIEIPLHVEKAGNRNYNKTEADGKMKILSPEESSLSINQPGKIYYGDHFSLRSLQDDSSSSNVNYTFEVDNTIFVSNPSVNNNMADFDALKCSNGAKINITVTRTADSEVTLSKKITIEVLPKDIEVIIDDKMKQKGEENPPLTFQDFTSQLVSWNGVQDVVDSGIVKLSTTATKDSKAGSYPITGNTKEMNTTYPNYNFIFKEGKLMVDSNIDKDADGDGKPDFNDPDGDGCPDLNIKWKDDSGNWVIINGDRDYDGIPDLNIDSDGDGIPDLNIDTDKDGKPDINLVILKKTDWKPTKCVVQSATVKEEYCTGTSAKPQINVDIDNDHIPDINIDHKGDFKAHVNISKDGKTPNVNIAVIHTWKPEKDYTKNNFPYDTMEIDEKKDILVNIDTDGDGRADVNIDFDGDGQPDINIDTDFDWIPDIDIDTTGDGKADTNLDTDHDGEPDENIIDITEWKPNKDGNKDGFPFDTMEIKQKTELEDNGIKVEKPDGTPFLPNFALKVEDVTDSKKEEIANDAKDFINETNEIKKVFDVKLLKDGIEIQPDGVLKVKIPYEGITNPILIRRLLDGTYEKIEYKSEGGYLVYETDELGIVSIIGNKEIETSVKGTYTPNIGGAITGDETNIHFYIGIGFIALGLISYLGFKRNKQKDTFQ